ncbi:MAG: Wzt carbohydrate-binding domain-containing protein [Planctomycetota bacterium]
MASTPVLTGRENVYVNAALLGLPRSKTQLIFDKIVEFAGIGEFIDAPVQGYSTGMRARLGYAVAAHLNTDILLIDEVLAVGDMGFRRKCRQHIRQYLNDGGTLILISHDMHAVQTICNRCIVLEKGKILFDGDVTSGVHVYYESQREHLQDETASEEKKTPESTAREVHRNGTHANATVSSERSRELAPEVPSQNPLDAILGELSNRSEATELVLEDVPGEKCVCQSSESEVSSESYVTEDDDVSASVEENLSYPADVDDPTPEEGEELAPVEVGGEGYDSEWSGDRALATETRIVIKAVHLRSVSGEVVRTGDDVQVTIDYWSAEDIPDLVWGFSLCTQDLGAHIGSGVFGFEGKTVDIHAGHGQLRCVIKNFPLMPGRYAVKAGIAESATGAEIANVGWDGTPAYFRVAATPSPLANIHSVLGDLVKLDIEWK